jgi:hypothetical protein
MGYLSIIKSMLLLYFKPFFVNNKRQTVHVYVKMGCVSKINMYNKILCIYV